MSWKRSQCVRFPDAANFPEGPGSFRGLGHGVNYFVWGACCIEAELDVPRLRIGNMIFWFGFSAFLELGVVLFSSVRIRNLLESTVFSMSTVL